MILFLSHLAHSLVVATVKLSVPGLVGPLTLFPHPATIRTVPVVS